MNDKPRNRRTDFIKRFTSDPDFAKQRTEEWKKRQEKRQKAVN